MLKEIIRYLLKFKGRTLFQLVLFLTFLFIGIKVFIINPSSNELRYAPGGIMAYIILVFIVLVSDDKKFKRMFGAMVFGSLIPYILFIILYKDANIEKRLTIDKNNVTLIFKDEYEFKDGIVTNYDLKSIIINLHDKIIDLDISYGDTDKVIVDYLKNKKINVIEKKRCIKNRFTDKIINCSDKLEYLSDYNI